MNNNEILSKDQENIPNITLSQLLTVFNQSTIDLDTIELEYDSIKLILEQLSDDKLNSIQKKIQLAVQEMTDTELSATAGGNIGDVIGNVATGVIAACGTVYTAKELAQTVVTGMAMVLAGGVVIYGIIDSIKQKRKAKRNRK